MDHLSEPSPDHPESVPSILRWGVFLELALALLALLVGALVGVDPVKTIELTWDAMPGHLDALLWGVVGTLPMLSVMVLIFAGFGI